MHRAGQGTEKTSRKAGFFCSSYTPEKRRRDLPREATLLRGGLDFSVIRHFEGDAEFSQFVRNVPELLNTTDQNLPIRALNFQVIARAIAPDSGDRTMQVVTRVSVNCLLPFLAICEIEDPISIEPFKHSFNPAFSDELHGWCYLACQGPVSRFNRAGQPDLNFNNFFVYMARTVTQSDCATT
jgi:hypothetical protein